MTLQIKHRSLMLKNVLAATVVWCVSLTTEATELQAFSAESMTAIENRYAGQSFVVGLWSLTCPPCVHELETLRKWHASNPSVPIVLIATDHQDQAEAVKHALEETGLSSVDNWLFADPFVEKLRFKIDPNWRGELPRSYLYMASGERHPISGALTTNVLNNWKVHTQAARAVAPKHPSSNRK